MNLDQLAAWGEFIGGIAVVAGLFFVGVQLVIANRESRLAANRTYAESIVAMGTLLNSGNDVAEIWFKGIHDLEQLTPVEKARFHSLVSNNILRTFENLHAHNKTGNLDDHIWNGAETMLQSTVVYPGFMEVWKTRRNFYNPEFQLFVDCLIENRLKDAPVNLYDFSPKNEYDT